VFDKTGKFLRTIGKAETGPGEFRTPARGRGRLHEIPHQYHCSIIGTCLSPSEVRKLLVKLRIASITEMTEGEIHHHAVMTAKDRTAIQVHSQSYRR